MTIDLDDIKRRMEGALNTFKNDLSGLRTGRANPALLSSVIVDAYGQKMPLTQVGTISVLESRMLSVQVWDKELILVTEKAIRESGLNLNPVTEGTLIRIPLPELNEERREELVKVAGKYTEQARISLRHVRRDGMERLKKAEKEGEISQDEQKNMENQVQKTTDEQMNLINQILINKEKEIRQI